MRRGEGWEHLLELLHGRYRRDRLAVVFRSHPPVKTLSELKAGRFTACWASDGPVDFLGTLAGGRAVALDAKLCASLRWPLGKLPLHQARDLEAVHLAGGLAGVLLRQGQGQYLLPWAELGPRYWAWAQAPDRAPRGTGSLALEAWWRPFDLAAGWLPAAEGL